jgi:DNA-nicking Smr family endonuclease
MKKTGQSAGRRGRPISSEEASLWEHATRTLVRVKAKPRVAAGLSPQGADESSAGTGAQKPTPRQQPTQPERIGAPREVARAALRTAPEMLDRRQRRRIAAGKTDIDGRIDLHGLRQAEAHARLRAFLEAAYAAGLTTVLVITGKGGEADRPDALGGALNQHQRGVLRRNVPLWLAQGELSHIVLGYGAAGTRHGGGGAFYVRLRKATRSG